MAINAQPGRTFFTGENVATTGVVYAGVNTQNVLGNGAEVALGTTGWLNSKYDHAVVQVGVATKTRSGNIVFRIEGRYPNLSNRPASILATLFSAAESTDRVINVVGKMSDIRLGVLSTIMPASPLASPCNIYAGVVFSEVSH